MRVSSDRLRSKNRHCLMTQKRASLPSFCPYYCTFPAQYISRCKDAKNSCSSSLIWSSLSWICSVTAWLKAANKSLHFILPSPHFLPWTGLVRASSTDQPESSIRDFSVPWFMPSSFAHCPMVCVLPLCVSILLVLLLLACSS